MQEDVKCIQGAEEQGRGNWLIMPDIPSCNTCDATVFMYYLRRIYTVNREARMG